MGENANKNEFSFLKGNDGSPTVDVSGQISTHVGDTHITTINNFYSVNPTDQPGPRNAAATTAVNTIKDDHSGQAVAADVAADSNEISTATIPKSEGETLKLTSPFEPAQSNEPPSGLDRPLKILPCTETGDECTFVESAQLDVRKKRSPNKPGYQNVRKISAPPFAGRVKLFDNMQSINKSKQPADIDHKSQAATQARVKVLKAALVKPLMEIGYENSAEILEELQNLLGTDDLEILLQLAECYLYLMSDKRDSSIERVAQFIFTS